MHLYPAIDIRQGRVVRLSQGEAARQTVYGTDPLAVAERFAHEGARWVHVVDLDRAFNQGDNDETIARLLAALRGRVGVQLGGGFRTLDRVRQWLELGADRVVIGTAAAVDPSFLGSAALVAPVDRLAVGVDAREGMVAVRGWTVTSDLTAAELRDRALEAGISTLIYTDVSRDGMLQGVDLDGALDLQRSGAQVIASGGVSTLDDIGRIAAAGLAGAIVGRALYESRFTLSEALGVAKREGAAE